MKDQRPFISIIIAIFNAQQTLAKCLSSIEKLDYPNFEIIAVDDGSTDSSAEICQTFPSVRFISQDNSGPSAARNRGVSLAKGNIIAFTDADCIVDPDWLNELVNGFHSDQVAGVGGNQLSPADESAFGRLVQDGFHLLGFATSYAQTPTRTTAVSHNPSCNASYQKQIFDEHGGFDESLWPGEDLDLDTRLLNSGKILVRQPRAIVRHYRPATSTQLARMMSRYGRSARKLHYRYGIFRPLNLLPFLTPFGALACGLLMFFYPIVLAVSLVIVLGLFGWQVMVYRSLSRAATLIWIIVLIVAAWHTGYYREMFQTIQT